MAETTTIKASARISTKIKEVFYTIEYGEDRSIAPDDDVEQERLKLFDDCFNAVAAQINDISNNG